MQTAEQALESKLCKALEKYISRLDQQPKQLTSCQGLLFSPPYRLKCAGNLLAQFFIELVFVGEPGTGGRSHAERDSQDKSEQQSSLTPRFLS